MKKKLCISLIAFLTVIGVTHAQEATTKQPSKLIIEKGTWNVSGNISFTFSQNESRNESRNEDRIFENEFTGVAFFPQLNYAVAKNFTLGVGLGYGQNTNESLSISGDSINNFSSGRSSTYEIFPNIRGYFPVGERLAFFAQGEFRFSRSTSEFNDEGTNLNINESRSDIFFVGIRPGLTFFVSKKIALETNLGSLGYNWQNSSFESESDRFDRIGESESFRFSLSSSDLFFGLSYYF